MNRQAYALIAVLCVGLGLLTIGGWKHSGAAAEYQQDLEYYGRKCGAERQSKEGEYKKDCQGIIYRTLDDPLALLTAGLTIATIALFGVTFALYLTAVRQGADAKEAIAAARSSAVAAERATSIAQRALTAEHRPWIPYPDIKLTSGFNYDADGASFVIDRTFKNTGKTPACDVYFKISAFLNGNNNASAAQKDAIEFAKNVSVSHGMTMFPADEITWSDKIRFSSVDLNTNRAIYGKFVRPIIIFTVRYAGNLSDDVFVTCISVDLAKAKDGKLAFMDASKSYAADELRLSSPIGNGYAD